MSTSTTSDYPQLFEADTGENVLALTFTTNGEHLICGCSKVVQVWRVKDGKLVATKPMEKGVHCVAASGRYIAAESWNQVVVWNATTFEQVSVYTVTHYTTVQDFDFSPDSTHIVFVNDSQNQASILNISDPVAPKRVHTFPHYAILAAKYSPQGDRVATAGLETICVWDGNEGRPLIDITDVNVNGQCGLHWHDNYLFVQAGDGGIKKIDASTGSTLSEWRALGANWNSRFALPQHGKFLLCSAKKTITFFDMSGNTQPSPIQLARDARSMLCSPDGQFLVVAAERKIIVKDLSSAVFRSVPEVEIDIDSTALHAWKHDQLMDAESLLSTAIPASRNSANQVLASRALVRARLGNWDSALVDAKESVNCQPSVIGYIAMCTALIGKGEKDEGIRVCDIALEHFYSEHVLLFSLVRAVILSMTGDHVDAISLMNDIAANAWVDPVLYVVQAYMYLLCGNECMESNDYQRAVQLFRDARIRLGNHTRQPPLIVTLISGWRFGGLALTVQQRLSEALLAADHTKEAGETVLRLSNEDIDMTESIKTWVSDFKYRCRNKSEDIGDGAMNAKQYDEAISQYTAALSLDPVMPQDLLVKRSRAYVAKGKWQDALNDASKVIKLDPSSPSGYERKYAALLGMGHHSDASVTFEIMLSKMSESSDPDIRDRSRHCVQTREAVRKAIKKAIRDSPLVLIDALSGRLCNKSEQAAAFESTPVFMTLITSMTTHVDHALINKAVGEFYRYATLSHTWEGDEPLYETVVKTVVYNLGAFPTHNKLQMFCKIARDEGFNWAWSDTCCINKGDQFILQEALVSMFKWYEGSALTIIFLCDVDQLAEIGALMMSLWNSRGWTLQEYHASKVIRIYTKDWTPYLGLTIYNHKESPEIISEMEKATGISAESLTALRPGLKDIREKLRLASTRQTTRIEDAAYSLLGIFSMTLPATYGEGGKALGRLLSQLLTSSGDTSILAWTGIPGSFNSCLPTDIAVFSQPLNTHIPPAIPYTEMSTITAGLLASSLDFNLVTRLYDELNNLPLPSFLVQRMKLPCLVFNVRAVSRLRNVSDESEVVFRARAGALGTVEIKTRQDIARVDSLYLVHPWIDFLLDRHAAGNIIDVTLDEDEFFDVAESPSCDSFPGPPSSPDSDPLDDAELPPSPTVPLMNVQMEFLARLRQPFGALLLAPTRRNVAEFRRIATENVITAQVQQITPATLNRLIEGVRVFDVL